MCGKGILENGGALNSVLDCYKNQRLCDKAVDNYTHGLKFVPGCYKTQKMRDKAVDTHRSTIRFVAECYKTQEMCYKAVNRCSFVFDSIPNQHTTKNKWHSCFFLSFFNSILSW